MDPVHSHFQPKGSGSQCQARQGHEESHFLIVSIPRHNVRQTSPASGPFLQGPHLQKPVRSSTCTRTERLRTQAVCSGFLQGEGCRVGGGDSLAPGGWRVGPRRPLPASPSSSPQGAGRKPDKALAVSECQPHPHPLPPQIPCTNTGLLPSGGNSKSSSFFYSCPHLCRQRGGKTNPAKSPRAPAVWQSLLCSYPIPSGSHRPAAESHRLRWGC